MSDSLTPERAAEVVPLEPESWRLIREHYELSLGALYRVGDAYRARDPKQVLRAIDELRQRLQVIACEASVLQVEGDTERPPAGEP